MRNGGKKLEEAERNYVLDASAVLALFRSEPGSDRVKPLLNSAWMHAVNVAEVVKKLSELGASERDIQLSFAELQVSIIEAFSVDQALAVGRLAAAGRKQGLSLGDCICITTAKMLGGIAVTAERLWAKMPQAGEVLLIR